MITRILTGDPILDAFDRFARYLATHSPTYLRDIAQAPHYMAKFNVNANIVKSFREDSVVKNKEFYSELRNFYNALRQYTYFYLSGDHQYDNMNEAQAIYDFIETHLNTAQEIESFWTSNDLLPIEHVVYVEYTPHLAARLLGWSTTLLMLGGGYYMAEKNIDEPLTQAQRVGYGCLILTAFAAGQAVTYFANKKIDPPQAPKKHL
ncbi:MAG: hypothetical protein WC748_03675 [Legionellales bacterium]|jgi:hypothetical protein